MDDLLEYVNTSGGLLSPGTGKYRRSAIYQADDILTLLAFGAEAGPSSRAPQLKPAPALLRLRCGAPPRPAGSAATGCPRPACGAGDTGERVGRRPRQAEATRGATCAGAAVNLFASSGVPTRARPGRSSHQ
jgi:hypothetical protein